MKESTAKKYERLAETVRSFVKAVKARKTMVAFVYKDSEAPKAIVPNAPPQQFNVLEVRQLIAHVITAQKLGYQTLLTANAGELFVNFAEPHPYVPVTLEIL